MSKNKSRLIFTYPLNFFMGDITIREYEKGVFKYYLYVDEKHENNVLYSRWISYDTAKSIIKKDGCDEWENSVTGKHRKADVLKNYFNK